MDERRRKLTFRAWRRGFREMELIMGSFADKYMAELTEAELDEFERLLAVPDWDVFGWITGTKEIPPESDLPLLDKLKKFKYTAQPGLALKRY